MKCKNLTSLLFLLLCFQSINAQIVKYERLKDLSLCLPDTVIISITNNKDNILDLNNVVLKLPCGLLFKGLVGSGEIIDSTKESVTIKIPQLSPNEVFKLSYKVLAPCNMIECIDNGDLFRYELITLVRTYSSPFFNIDSPGLNIVSIMPETVEGITGKPITRKITLKNTRPGRLSNFIYRDSTIDNNNKPVQIIIGYDKGKNLKSTDYLFEILFDKEVFKTIGNKDDFFDFDESIEILISYKELSCNVVSFIQFTSIAWGCNNQLCNIKEKKSFGNISNDYTIEEPLIYAKVNTSDPDCYMGEVAEQELLLINPSMCTYANNIELKITDTLTAKGIIGNSIISNNTSINIQYIDEISNSCNLIVFKQAIIQVSQLGPNDTLKIKWMSGFCSEPYYTSTKWEYKVNYDRGCVSEFFRKEEPRYEALPNRSFFPTEFFFEKDKIFVQNQPDTIVHIVKSSKFQNYNGKVRFTYTLPCNIEILPSTFRNNNKFPTYIEIDNNNNQNTLTLEYKLPFENHGVNIYLPLKVDCDKDCGSITDTCGKVVVSRCSHLCTTNYIIQNLNVKMEIIDSIIPCLNGYPVTYFTEPIKTTCFDFACPDTLAAYLDHTFSFERSNYGYADNNNDEVPEVNEVLNFTKIKKHTVLVGDTIDFIQNGKIVVDKKDAYLNYFTIQIDADLNEFLGNNRDKKDSIFRALFFSGEIDFSAHNLILKDKSTNTSYNLESEEIMFNDSLSNIIFRYSLDELKSKKLLPSSYVFKTNDSLYFKAQVVLRNNFPSQWAPAIARRNIFSKMKVDLKFKTYFSEKLVEDIDDIYVCQCNEVQLEVCSYYSHFNELGIFANDDALYCEGQSMSIGFISNYYGIKPEIFTYEVRELFPAKAISVKTKGYLKINKMHILAYSDDRLIYSNPNALFTDFGDSTVHIIPDNVIFGELNEIRMEIHMTLNQDIHDVGLSDIVQINFLYDEIILPPYFQPDVAVLKYEVPFAFPDLSLDKNVCDIFDKTAQYKVKIFNEPFYSNTAENAFMYIDPNLSPDIKINRIVIAKTGVELIKINGLYQLGQVRPRENLELIFDITSSSCKDEPLYLYVGWSCNKVNSPRDKPTGEVRKLFINLKHYPGVIDMAYSNMDFKTELCTQFDTIEITIVNGDFGSIHDMKHKMELPRGMSFIPGSFTFTHPNKGQAISFPDPKSLGSNTYSYEFDKILNKFLMDGMKGILNENLHLFTLKFLATTDCDFISGTKAIYKTEAKQKCGKISNRRSKVSPYFLIASLDTIEQVDIIIDEDVEFVNCENTASIKIQINKYISNNKEWKLFLKIPDGVRITNNKIKLDGVESTLSYDGIYYFISLDPLINVYNVDLDFNSELSQCEDLILTIFTTITRNAFCVEENKSCNIEQVTGDAYLPIRIRKPDYKIANATINNITGNTFITRVNIENNGSISNKPLNLKIIFDANDNYKPDEGEFVFLDTLIKNESPSFTVNIVKNTAILKKFQLCKLIVFIDETENCICSGDYSLMNGFINYSYPVEVLCWDESIDLKVEESLSGESYFWTPLDGLICSQCVENNYNPLNDNNPSNQKQFLFYDNVTDRCAIEYEFNLSILPKSKIEINDSIFCFNEEVNLKSNSSQNNQWILNNKVISQDSSVNILLNKPMKIYLTNRDEKHCSSSDSISLSPYKIPLFNAGNDTTLCYRNNLFLNPSINDDLDFIWIDKNNALSDTIIENPLITKNISSSFILKVCDNKCCDYDTVAYSFVNVLDFQLPFDTIFTCFNDSIKIELDSSFNYIWSDNVKEFCLVESCSKLLIPVSSNEMLITATAVNNENCKAYDELIINAIEFIELPEKIFKICDGDSVLIKNNFIKSSGIYCDTSLTLSGCKNIQCYNVIINTTSIKNRNESICEGNSFSFYEQSLNSEGKYCKDFQNLFGCDSSICVELKVNPNPVILLDSFIYNVAQGTEVIIEEKGNHNHYLWNSSTELSCNNCDTPIFIAEENTTLNLVVTDEYNCKDTVIIRVNVLNQLCFENLQIPNAFTPNGNSINEKFKLVNAENIVVDQFEIYNEWSQKIYTAKNNDGWDGRIDGIEAPPTTYAYVIKVNCSNESKIYKGYVSLLR